MPLKVEVQLQDASIEAALESVPLRHLPLLVDNCEGDILVGHTRTEANRQSVSRPILLQVELGCARLIGQIRVENVELVALHDFWGWVLRVVVRLIVLVPFVALLDAIEESWLAHDEQLLRGGHFIVCIIEA